jgi:hypothetical protein
MVTAIMAEAGLVRTINFFIKIVVTLIRNDEDIASIAASMENT